MNEVSKELLCVYMRSGVEIWVERARAENFIKLLGMPNAPQFTEIDGNLVNRADITGIFTAAAMEDMKRRKNGGWQCSFGTWHERKQECGCRPKRQVNPEDEALGFTRV